MVYALYFWKPEEYPMYDGDSCEWRLDTQLQAVEVPTENDLFQAVQWWDAPSIITTAN